MSFQEPPPGAPYRFFDDDVELALLAQLLANPQAVTEATLCTVEDFGWEGHARIFESAKALHDEGFKVTPLAVKSRLSGGVVQDLERKTGKPAIQFFEALASSASPLQNPGQLSRIISDLALLRRLDAELEAARVRIGDRSAPVTVALAGVVDVIGEVLDQSARAKGHRSVDDIADGILQSAEEALNGIKPHAIRTGLDSLDRLTGGLHPGDLAIVAGRPGMGKSVLLSHIALRAAIAGFPAVFFSLEMPSAQLLERAACDVDYDTRPNGQKPLYFEAFRAGTVTDAEFGRLYGALAKIRPLPLEIHDSGGLSMPQISAVAERYAARKKGLGIVVVDYLQLVAMGDRYRGSRVNEVGEVTAASKNLAKRLGWPVVLGCQLSRAVEGRDNKRPTLADLRDSGTIEQDADLVASLYRSAYYIREKRPARGQNDPNYPVWLADYRACANDLEINLLKNRHGRTGAVMVHCHIGASAVRNRVGEATTVTDDEFPEDYVR